MRVRVSTAYWDKSVVTKQKIPKTAVEDAGIDAPISRISKPGLNQGLCVSYMVYLPFGVAVQRVHRDRD